MWLVGLDVYLKPRSSPQQPPDCFTKLVISEAQNKTYITMRSYKSSFVAASLLPALAATQHVGEPYGFAAGVTGGGDAAPAIPAVLKGK